MWSLAARHGWGFVQEAARDLMDDTERRTRAALAKAATYGGRRIVDTVERTAYEAVDYLEGDGVSDADIPIRVRVEIRDGTLHADFTGTSAAVAGNVNCPLAVTRAAVLFVVQVLVGEDVPMNAGVARAVRVTAPEGCLVNARRPRAVAAGNVETSQRIADVLFRALAEGGMAVPAQGQGTMNNVTLGGSGPWTYYETLGGGQGASPSGPGPSGVHVGMSNTRNTPIEVLEMEYPVRVRSYQLRRGSGGAGRWRGGDGVIREFEMLAPAEASILTERRRRGARGAAGGSDGAPGRNLLNGALLAAHTNVRLLAADVLRIETPGGGGWGVAGGDNRTEER
jgi:N-methylhydantoinase B